MTSNPLDEIQARHEKVDATYKAGCSCCTTPDSHVDRGKLVAALRAVEALIADPEHLETQGPHDGYVAVHKLVQSVQQALNG